MSFFSGFFSGWSGDDEPDEPDHVAEFRIIECRACQGKGRKPLLPKSDGDSDLYFDIQELVEYARIRQRPPCQVCHGAGLLMEAEVVDKNLD